MVMAGSDGLFCGDPGSIINGFNGVSGKGAISLSVCGKGISSGCVL